MSATHQWGETALAGLVRDMVVAAALTCGLVACASTPTGPLHSAAADGTPLPAETAQDPVADASDRVVAALTHTSLPGWTDKYRRSGAAPRFLNIGELIETYALSRAQAVEVQNLVRDATSAAPNMSGDAALSTAVAAVRDGRFERRFDSERIASASFVAVFDLDETLWDQRVKTAEGCHDLAVMRGGKERRIKMTPGWQDAIKKLHAAGAAVVLFSANLDATIRINLDAIKLDGVSLWDHPAVAAVLTNSHLTVQSKHEGAGKSNPRRGAPVSEPSKDLRQFDPSLQRVIIVDDNPRRLFQFGNTRVFKKFHGDELCAASAAHRKMLERQLPVVVDELLESARFAKANAMSFVQAYRPFTILGQDAVRALRLANGWDEAAAIAYVRAHPEVVGSRY